MKQFFSTIMNSWGSDTPQEVIWSLNDLLTWAKSKGFQTKLEFGEELNAFSELQATQICNDNKTLVQELSKFFESASY
jgi:hypothetical protein